MKVSKMKFFGEEVTDLLKAWLVISIAFAIVMNRGFSLTPKLWKFFIVSAVTVGTGFLLHELAHKYFAQRYRCFAKFRSDDKMLVLALITAFFGFIFAAPGAVMIRGNVNDRRRGIISASGPITNLVLAVVFLGIKFLPFNIELLSMISLYGFIINVWIGLFNLIPFGIFDGRKILAWNKMVYYSLAGVALAMLFLQGYIGIGL